MIELNQIYEGDCMQIMKCIDDESIDMMITSPPYNVGSDYDIYDDDKEWAEYLNLMTWAMFQVYRVIKTDGRIAINISHVIKNDGDENKHFPFYLFSGNHCEKRSHLSDFLQLLIEVGFNIREIISWFKASDENHFSGGSTAWGSFASASNPHLRGQVEVIIVANKGPWKKTSGSGISDITGQEFKEWTKSAWFIHAEANREHPAPFPIEIPLRLIKLYTFVGDIVIDPFLGSGTTALACVQVDRNYIGIDISPKYVRMAKERIFVETRQLMIDFETGMTSGQIEKASKSTQLRINFND